MPRSILLPLLLLLPAYAGDAPPEERAGAIAEKLAAKDADTVLAGLREAAGDQDPSLTVPLTRLLKDGNPAVRVAAIEALGLRKPAAEKKRAAKALAARIAALARAEQDRDELLKVVAALHDLADPVALGALLDDIKPDSDREVSAARMRAAANIPSKEVVDELLKLASAGRRRGAHWRMEEALRALRYATQEDVKGGVEEWRRWWSDNKRDWDPAIAANTRADERLKEQEKDAKRREKRERRKKD